MKVTYSCIIYSCLIFGTGILCDRKLERRQAISSGSENTDDYFHCSNGESIEWSLLCDSYKDCSDGSDEIKELCALYEFETNITMDCGRVHNIKNLVSSEESHQSINELSPWTVAIYQMNKKSKIIYYLHAGSIISPNIVISASHDLCMNGITSKQTPINDGEYKIGEMEKFLNDRTRLTNVPKLLIIQSLQVTMIYLTRDYNSCDDIKQQSIAVFMLANKVSFRNGFAPICIDWFSKYNIQKEAQMTTMGIKFNENETKLMVIQGFITYMENKTCMKHFNYIDDNKLVTGPPICVKINKEQDIQIGIRGLGLSILYSNTYFLTGIMNDWKTRNINNHSAVSILNFIDIKYHVPWLRGILNKHVTVNSCVLPTVEGVIYSYEGSNEILSHGTLIDRHFNVIENCEVGYHKAYRNSFRFCRGKGKWLSSSDKLCFKMCPPLESDGLDFKCTYNYKYANCSNPSIPDTIATPLCEPQNGYEMEPQEILCLPNGTWNKEHGCNPNPCKLYDVINGSIKDVGSAPWNVALYKLKYSNYYDLICGGSIISPKLVVSAAHCFVNYLQSKRIPVNADLYKIAVGKFDRDINITDKSFTKIMDVDTVHLNDYYHGISTSYANDIAIVVLRNRITFSIGVSPICVDWIGINTVPNGTKGKIVGWGKTENNTISNVLLEASLPYIDHFSCWDIMYRNEFASYVTYDKFCAGSEFGQGVLEGDSGAGLCFLHSNFYYLTGITSVKDPENMNSSIAVFTEVKHHIQWIRRLYNKYN